TRVAERLLESQPRLTLVQVEMLERALASYQELIQDDDADPDLRFRTAQAYHFVARLYQRVGRPGLVEQPLREQLTLLEGLAAEDRGERKYRFDLFHGRLALASALAGQGRHADSAAQTRHALALIRLLVRDYPAEPFYRDALAHQAGDVARLLADAGRLR